MNFLSHYYFDRSTTSCYFVLGTVLPDLLKNADKNIILHPEKLHHTNSHVNDIIKGWNKHLEVDRYFHSSPFFTHHSHNLKLKLLPAIEGSPVKPFFLGHVALELILDNLLLTTGQIQVDEFYNHLGSCDEKVIAEFLHFGGMANSTIFFNFFDVFKNEGYLHTYADTQKIAYALKRICMRIWKNPFTPAQEAAMDDVIIAYREELLESYLAIFNDIEKQLSHS
ncbi:hypothetical protein GCM10023149_52360 [Mucilaginibacter gynuensis]|uniref:Acyl carrier protein phosphodiesterase n=1 Tax=Mucilaginibacter gynuensis TaxID=1302236 RepID=A0ABP8HKR8_9SPHI